MCSTHMSDLASALIVALAGIGACLLGLAEVPSHVQLLLAIVR